MIAMILVFYILKGFLWDNFDHYVGRGCLPFDIMIGLLKMFKVLEIKDRNVCQIFVSAGEVH